MKCCHGVTGPCAQCSGESTRGDLLMEVARLVRDMADTHGLDTSGLEALMRRLR